MTTFISGMESWHGYLSALLGFRAGPLRFFQSSPEPLAGIPLCKYVDITAFTSLLTHSAPWVGLAVFLSAALGIAATLCRRWLTSVNVELIWATAISATLVANLYTPIYDASLEVIGIMLTIAVPGATQGKTPEARS
jgi:hypothetical protein